MAGFVVSPPGRRCSGTGACPLAAVLAAVVVMTAAAAESGDPMQPTSSGSTLSAIEGSPEVSTESTIVEVPISVTLKAPEDGRIGFRLRLSVFFAWNDVRFEDVDGDDIAASLRTLTVVPGAELVVPVGERWVVRPYGQIGGLNALGMDGHRWLASLGTRVSTSRNLERWRLLAGGRVEYTTVLDEDFRRVDDVAFLDLGAGFSWPLWFEVTGEPASAGLFVFPRLYLNPAEVVSQGALVSGNDWHLEVGVSFEIQNRPKLWLVSLPSWYGAALRVAPDHRSVRIYLGFPF
jgi:hypothetical protein